MSRLLNDLTPALQEKAFELIARCCEAGIAVMIIDTLRTIEEQKYNVSKGVSWTMNSKHLPDKFGKSHAIDLCPYDVYNLHGADKLRWDSNDASWQAIGKIGEDVGLIWGGRWKGKADLGHFELL